MQAKKLLNLDRYMGIQNIDKTNKKSVINYFQFKNQYHIGYLKIIK